MNQQKRLNRRAFLRLLGGVGAVSALGTSLSSCASPAEQVSAIPTVAQPNVVSTAITSQASASNEPDVELALRATTGEVPILPGQSTKVWVYQGEVLAGDPATLQTLDGSYLGPLIRVRKGQKVRIHFTNDLPDESIIHWHGLHVPEEADGHPRYAIKPGDTYVYDFEVRNRAGTYWYHPHPHGQTGHQVYQGLAGLFLVSDEEERAIALPTGEYDVPLVIQDRLFDADNQLLYLPNGMHDRMMGFVGDQILVNGQPNFTLKAATRIYRIRLLNGSNSNIYQLAWDDGTPLTVIGTDGGLLEKPQERKYIMLGPAERIELWVDFSQRSVGEEMALLNWATSDRPSVVLSVRVEHAEEESLRLPEQLTTITRFNLAEAVNRENPRRFSFDIQQAGWTINGRVFEMEEVADEEIVRLNTLEVWELVNEANGMHMVLPHPIHIHGGQFQILERQIEPSQKAIWDAVKDGYVDDGWHDTVLLMPGERIKLLFKFEDYEGMFLYHCHNLEHEDMGMMRNYLVRAS